MPNSLSDRDRALRESLTSFSERVDQLDRLVRSRLIRGLYNYSNEILLTTFGVATIVAALVVRTHSVVLVTGWWTLLVLWSFGRGALTRRFRSVTPEHDDLDVWGLRFAVGSAGAGVLWGIAGTNSSLDVRPFDRGRGPPICPVPGSGCRFASVYCVPKVGATVSQVPADRRNQGERR